MKSQPCSNRLCRYVACHPPIHWRISTFHGKIKPLCRKNTFWASLQKFVLYEGENVCHDFGTFIPYIIECIVYNHKCLWRGGKIS
jgi:hypothetical protein